MRLLLGHWCAVRFLEYHRVPRSLPSDVPLREGRLLSRAVFEVTEKVHGAHLSVSVDASGALLAKRTGFLDPTDEFFGANALLPDLAARAASLLPHLAEGEVQFDVHGELFGGAYPHPEVPVVPGARPVQSGVWYSPDVRFCAFDLFVWQRRGMPRLVPSSEARPLLAGAGFFTLPVLQRGRLSDLDLALPDRTTLPALFGLPPLPSNPAEGLVVKAESDLALPVRDALVRPVFKVKSRLFDEERFRPADAPPSSPAAALDAVTSRLLLDSALSKLGRSELGPALDLATQEALVLADGLYSLSDLSSSERIRLLRRARARLESTLSRDERRALRRS